MNSYPQFFGTQGRARWRCGVKFLTCFEGFLRFFEGCKWLISRLFLPNTGYSRRKKYFYFIQGGGRLFKVQRSRFSLENNPQRGRTCMIESCLPFPRTDILAALAAMNCFSLRPSSGPKRRDHLLPLPRAKDKLRRKVRGIYAGCNPGRRSRTRFTPGYHLSLFQSFGMARGGATLNFEPGTLNWSRVAFLLAPTAGHGKMTNSC
jgi:hypothetical protein